MLGYQVDIFNLADYPLPWSRLESVLKARGFEGLVFIATVNPELLKEVSDMGTGYPFSVARVYLLGSHNHIDVNDKIKFIGVTSRDAIRSAFICGLPSPVS